MRLAESNDSLFRYLTRRVRTSASSAPANNKIHRTTVIEVVSFLHELPRMSIADRKIVRKALTHGNTRFAPSLPEQRNQRPAAESGLGSQSSEKSVYSRGFCSLQHLNNGINSKRNTAESPYEHHGPRQSCNLFVSRPLLCTGSCGAGSLRTVGLFASPVEKDLRNELYTPQYRSDGTQYVCCHGNSSLRCHTGLGQETEVGSAIGTIKSCSYTTLAN